MKPVVRDYSKLRGLIREKFGTEYNLGCKLKGKVSKPSLSKKLNGKAEWTQSQILLMCKALGIADEDIPKYFFSREGE